ncbi:hypothetical protein ASF87_10200 [Microbacterium sp. Leaf161]|uniref:GAP family protein n=1 Tax=Microbacterium sp. Leaf161 TaxID=1736281 RepID=UPI0006F22541|nr:GAP family protein [Microbacterium sp. Leaf161]KQR49156.1 hypothetical protein ASF87_10200 [Microbacterium sp. Leaf161]
MPDVLGMVLPNAVAIAISPLPVVAVILILMAPQSRLRGVVFLIGWFFGVVVATGLFALLADVIPATDSSAAHTIVSIVQIVLGSGLLWLGWRHWRTRPAPGKTPMLPAWMSKLDTLSASMSGALAFALSAVNPKNLLVAASAGSVLGTLGTTSPELWAAVGVFALLASLSVLVPVVLVVVAPATSRRVLTRIREWLTANSSVIMTTLFLIVGAHIIGTGISAL